MKYEYMHYGQLHDLPTGELVHAMMIEFSVIAARKGDNVYHQSPTYLQIVEILNDRFNK